MKMKSTQKWVISNLYSVIYLRHTWTKTPGMSFSRKRMGHMKNKKKSDLSISQARTLTLAEQYKRHWPLIAMLSPVLLYYLIFRYAPMSGIILAFKDFKFNLGILNSPWAKENGLGHFIKMFHGIYFWPVFRNTIIIGFYKIIVGFPVPIFLALLFNEIKNVKFKKVAQTITYMPYFISWIVLASIVIEVLSPSRGFVNYFLGLFGVEPQFFVGDPKYFRWVIVYSYVWRNAGYQTIVFLAAMSGINPEQYEAAEMDGAGRIQRIIHVTIPSIMPTIAIMFIMAMGGIMTDDFDQVYNLLNSNVMNVGDVISTYTYRVGLEQMNFSYAIAVGLFKNIIALIFLTGSNYISKKVTDSSLF